MKFLVNLCQHRYQTTPRKDAEGEYRRCLECAQRIPWSWTDDISISPPKRCQPPQRSLLGDMRPLVWKPMRRSA